MGLEILTYQPEVYTQLPEYEEASTTVPSLREPLEQLLSLIARHGLQKHVGICLLHKHFEMSADEKLAEERGEYFSFLRPVTDGHEKLLPYMWKVSEDNGGELRRLLPLEFAENTNEQLQESLAALTANTVFIDEVSKSIADMGLTNTLGIIVCHRQHITQVDGSSMEYSDLARRLLHVVPQTKEPLDSEILKHFKHHVASGKEITKGPTAWYVGSSLNLGLGEMFGSAKVDWCAVCSRCCHCSSCSGCCQHSK